MAADKWSGPLRFPEEAKESTDIFGEDFLNLVNVLHHIYQQALDQHQRGLPLRRAELYRMARYVLQGVLAGSFSGVSFFNQDSVVDAYRAMSNVWPGLTGTVYVETGWFKLIRAGESSGTGHLLTLLCWSVIRALQRQPETAAYYQGVEQLTTPEAVQQTIQQLRSELLPARPSLEIVSNPEE